MIYLVLFLCTDAYHTSCIVQHASPMPSWVTTEEAKQQCQARKLQAEWLLSSKQFLKCEEFDKRVQM